MVRAAAWAGVALALTGLMAVQATSVGFASSASLPARAMSATAAAAPAAPDYDQFPVPQAPVSNAGLQVTQFRYPLPRQTVSVTVARASNPLPYFAIFPAAGSGGSPYACQRANTSTTAARNGCAFATNAGFFDMKTSACLGNLVSDDAVLQADPTWPHPTFGTSEAGHYVIGYFNVSAAAATAGVGPFRAAVSGIGWLVRDGAGYINASAAREGMDHTFLSEIAPRTAVGFDGAGALVVVQVDGEEDILSGVNLWEFERILLSPEVGARSAVNLDGGGSSVSVYDGRVISTPHCIDTPKVCERAVTTITCVLGPSADDAADADGE